MYSVSLVVYVNGQLITPESTRNRVLSREKRCRAIQFSILFSENWHSLKSKIWVLIVSGAWQSDNARIS